MLGKLSDIRNAMLRRSAVRRGLRLGRDVRIIGKPDFGSEPYLVEIGDHVTISAHVTFVTHDGGTWVFRHLPEYAGLQRFGRIKIGNNCFVGARAIILPDVSIGDDCVIGAGSVVTRSVPGGSVVAGVPARFVCSYDDYVRRSAPRCRHYAPDVAADPARLRASLESLPPAGAEERTEALR